LAGRAAWGWLAAAGVFAGAALSVKWTGLAFVGLILLFEGLSWLVQLRKLRAPSLRGIARMALVAMLTASVYVASFALHFALAYKTGPDDAAMSPQFQATLQGNPLASNAALERPGFAGKFVELHQRMFHNTRTTLGPHAYASRWYDWPFMMRTVDFWAQHTQAADGPRYAHIYFMGNPVVWWATGYCMLFLLVNFLPKLAAWGVRARTQLAEPTEVFLIVAYLANMLPFVGIARIMFAYHYLPALCIALLGLGLLLDRTGVYKVRIGVALLVVALASFVYFAPLSYGLPLAPANFDARFWVKTWR
jgi:dolichyl-phosphate-mannose-protein mannosyltransferase